MKGVLFVIPKEVWRIFFSWKIVVKQCLRRFDAKVAWMLLNMLRFKKCHLSFIFIAHMKPLLNILNFEPTNILSFWRLFWKNFTVLLLVFRAFQDFFNEPFEPFRVFRAFRGLLTVLSLSSFSKLLRLFLDFENS